MLAECVRTFRDIEAGTVRREGDRFEVTPERLKAINSTKYGQLAKEAESGPKIGTTGPEKATAAKAAPKRRRTTRKPKE